MSGGYAGAKRTQMFLCHYLQRTADARDLGIRFVTVAPRQFLVGTVIGEAAAAAYGAEAGVSGHTPALPGPAGPGRRRTRDRRDRQRRGPSRFDGLRPHRCGLVPAA
jgi:hypothetical protein